MADTVNILFGYKQYDEDSPAERLVYYYFSLLDDSPCEREVVIGKVNISDEDKAAYIINYILNNTHRFANSNSIISFFESALDYHHDSEKYKGVVMVGVSARFDIFKRDGFRCLICGRATKDGITLEVDHIIPRSFGGGNEPDNLQTLCFDCNRGRSNKRLFSES